ncbi:MAG: hypothetical protein K8S00_12230 [Bacteroidales bacterium]|nr:hypothetical protein [Bacteroidales bacterium]
MQTLLDSQKSAISKLKKYKVGALFMEPGTGKTRAAFELVKSVDPDYVLYLAPYQAINTTNYNESVVAEIERYGGFQMQHDFIGVESLSASDRIYLNITSALRQAQRPFIICDESLKIKNVEAKRTKRILFLSTLAEYKLVLNGTPVSRNLLDLWSQMEFLSPKILKMDTAEYKNTFCEYTTMRKRIGRRSITREWINRYHNLDYLYSLISPFVFEADLSINIKVQFIDIHFCLTEQEKKDHEYLKRKYLDNEVMELRNNNIFLEITQKLQHNYSCSPEKFEITRRILSRHDKSKILICVKYIDTREKLSKAFPGIRIISWQKNAFALNLQDYNIMIKWDKHWDYALHDQLMHRIYRHGQQHDCIVYDFCGNVGLEDMMKENVDKKGALLKAFKNKTIEELKKEV